MIEKRGAPRRDVDIPAMILSVGDGTDRKKARIVNVSDEGAMIDTGSVFRWPKKIWLLELEHENIYDCEVKWAKGSNIGVQIVDVLDRQRRLSIMKTIAS